MEGATPPSWARPIGVDSAHPDVGSLRYNGHAPRRRRTAARRLVLAAPAEARPGDLDPTFAGGGRTALVVGDSNTTPSGLSLIAGFRPLVAVRAENKGRLLPMLLRFTGGGASGGRILLPAATDAAAVLDGSRWLVGLAPKTEDSTQLALKPQRVGSLAERVRR